MRVWRLQAESPDNWHLLQKTTGYKMPGQFVLPGLDLCLPF